MKFLKNKKGFTLIELLVVVSIIGVLATIVLASLGEARSRAELSKIKTTMRQIQNQIELYNIDNGNYSNPVFSGSTCPTTSSLSPTNIFESPEIFSLITEIGDMLKLTNPYDPSDISCFANTQGYTFAIRLSEFTSFARHNNGDAYLYDLIICIDGNGNFSHIDTGDADELSAATKCFPDDITF